MQALRSVLADNGVTQPLTPLVPDLPVPVYTCPVSGAQALGLWRQLRGEVGQTGYWPLLLGDAEELEGFEENLLADAGRQPLPPILVEQSLPLNLKVLLRSYLHEALESESEADVEAELESVRGTWPIDFVQDKTFALLADPVTREPYPIVILGFVPTKMSWHVPAYLYYGDWNACPPATHHCALLHYWQEEYGAELVGMSFDTLDLRVSQPPSTRAVALRLAEEQFAYSPDIIEQGVGTISALAAQLLDNPVWFFWWD